MPVQDIKTIASFAFLYLTALFFAVVIAWQILHGMSPSEISVGFVTTVIGYAINDQGVNRGAANAAQVVQSVLPNGSSNVTSGNVPTSQSSN